ncbi:hypothetical protein ACFL0Q_09660 [Thermodesulfobacteriota bacterium]
MRGRMSKPKSEKLPTGAQSIMHYLEISELMFRALIQEGMLAQFINNTWFAYADSLEELFRSFEGM